MSTDLPSDSAATGAAPTPASPTEPENGSKDAQLPDPSGIAKLLALLLMLGTVVAAIAIGDNGTKPFDPKGKADADLAFFAGFFLAAQAIERALELIAPFIPFWTIPLEVEIPTVTTIGAERQLTVETRASTRDELTAQKKTDRGFVMLSIGALFGVGVSAAMGLYLPEVIGVMVPRWLDMLVTGLAISGGTKGLHELIKTLQKAKEPGTTAG
jgi:hypothetical protein